MPDAFYRLVLVQFISTLADNAFLIVAIARVMELDGPSWLIPVLKISFTLFYVVLAPFVGPLADAFPKGRVILFANTIKAFSLALLLLGASPIVAIGLAGLGASISAPARYGLVTEWLPARYLVRANGYLEGGTVTAVILGTVLGGVLVSPVTTQWHPVIVHPLYAAPASDLTLGMLILLAMNTVAAMLSHTLADSGVRYATQPIHIGALMARFARENGLLWRDPLGGLSMAVTTLLWGVGATLQLIVLRWAHDALHMELAQAAYLQGVTALGIISGAVLASRRVSLAQAPRLLPIGMVLGTLIPLLLLIDGVWAAAGLLMLVGLLAGFFVVPMNALLQHQGCTRLTAGRSIAVQGFNENLGMLLMLGAYAGAIAIGCPLPVLIAAFATLVTGAMLLIWITQRHTAAFQTNATDTQAS